MRKLKKLSACFLCLCLLMGLGGCGAKPAPADDGKLQIVATLFPQYDFARQIAGDCADVTLLLPPGVESHSFEPTPGDIVKINDADLFVYTGEQMEPWARQIIDALDEGVSVLDISEHIQLDADADDHEHGGTDPHIWTSPVNAKAMVDNLAAALSAADPQNSGVYQTNAVAYKEKLDKLDEDFWQVVETGKRREIVFGGRFALHYFAEEYHLSYLAAFDSCSHETEPSAKVVAEIIDEIKREGIPVIYHEELTDPKVARSISEETGAKLLLLHSCHNVSKQELEAGATYLSLMEQNVLNLKEGLN